MEASSKGTPDRTGRRSVYAVRTRSRRQLLVDLGRGSLAIAVFGLAACADPSGNGSQATPQPGDSPTDTPDPQTEAARGSLTWERVNLGFVSAYVLLRGTEAAVVDTGVEGSADAIGESLSTLGSGWDAVRHVVLTHHHPDHAGSLAEVLGRASGATAYAGKADIAQITGKVAVADDGADIFGTRIIATPGHTLGHVSVLDEETRVLVVGDAMNNNDGVTGSNPQFTADEEMAAQSVRKLAKLDVGTVLFGHGEPLLNGAREAIAELAASLTEL